ncbi:YcaO-like family protein [Streptococcus ruminantium]|uniref:YcaO-like family protein n=1 Tax=Streptococcus ruminantium TaxID=1917441 RepID=UPI001F2315EA|nr:YcaO-like family protein [Streptococcus ruminantium]BDD38505.1 hypothetical protein GUT183_07430 [Streptococcus ruminantium]
MEKKLRLVINKYFPFYSGSKHIRTQELLNESFVIKEYIDLSNIDINRLSQYLSYCTDIEAIEIDELEGIIKLFKKKMLSNYFDSIGVVMEQIGKIEKWGYFKIESLTSIGFINRNILELEGMAEKQDLQSEAIAFIEYMERLCSLETGNIVNVTLEDITKENSLFFESMNTYLLDNSTVQALELSSLLNSDKIIVPHEYIYYASKINSDLIVESGSSNGCAVGNSYEDAVIRGGLEVIERSDFMDFWFNDAKIVELELDMTANQLRFLINELERKSYQVRFFYVNCRDNSSIKTVWCLAESKNKKNYVYSMSGLASDFSIEVAVSKSFFEMKRTLDIWNTSDYYIKMKKFKQLSITNNILDNILIYFSNYERKNQFSVMLDGIEKVRITEIKNCESRFYINKYLELLETVKQYYKNIYVEDMTNKPLADLGLVCTKVLITGCTDIEFKSKKNKYNFDYQPIA